MGSITTSIKRLLPKTLLGRSLLIIVTPLVVLQLVSAAIFFETHWDKVTLRLARGVAGDISAVINLLRRHPDVENRSWIFWVAAENMEMVVSIKDNADLASDSREPSGLMERMLARALTSHVSRPFRIASD